MDKGIASLLKHRVIFHEMNDEYLYDDLITLFYPYPYRTNIIEALTVLKAEDQLDRVECHQAIDYLKEKQSANGYWQAEKVFMKSSWMPFDPIKNLALGSQMKLNGCFQVNKKDLHDKKVIEIFSSILNQWLR